MLPQYPISGSTKNFERAEIYNRYLQHADLSELKRLHEEVGIVINSLNDTQVPTLDCAKTSKSFSNIFKTVLYLSSEGQIKTWDTTKGRRPDRVLDSSFAQLRNVNFNVRNDTFEDCTATGFKRYTKKQKTLQLMSIVGLLIVCFDKPLSEYTYLSQIRKPELFKLLDELEKDYGVKTNRESNKILIEDMGPYLSGDPINFIKVAFPHGIVVRNGVTYQIY